MARPLRIQYPGAVYYVTHHAPDRKLIFRDNGDKEKFLDILSHSLETYGVRLHSFVLLPDHFHLLVETPRGNLAEFMRHFNITYTSYFNRRYEKQGNLFRGRYKSVVVDKKTHLAIVSNYIHLNPIRLHRFSQKPMKARWHHLLRFKWSSLPGYLDARKHQDFICYADVLGCFGGQTGKGRRLYRSRLEADLQNGLTVKKQIVAQSILGDAAFVAEMRSAYLAGGTGKTEQVTAPANGYVPRESVIHMLEKRLETSFDEIVSSRGILRLIAMDVLYRLGGMKNREIGVLMGLDYTTISLGRKYLHEEKKRNVRLRVKLKEIESDCPETIEHALFRRS